MAIEDVFTQLGSPDNVFSVVDIITVLFLSTFLAFIIATVYQRTHDNISYSMNFTQTMIIFGVVVAMIMLIIGSNIARAFTLVGALSIVRFRNAVKETRDVGYIFLMMAVGMAVGTRFYVLAIIMTFFLSILILLMFKTNFGSKKEQDELLKIEMPDGTEKNYESVFGTYLSYHDLLSVESTEKPGYNEAVYLIRFKPKVNRNGLVKDIKARIPECKVQVHGTDHIIY